MNRRFNFNSGVKCRTFANRMYTLHACDVHRIIQLQSTSMHCNTVSSQSIDQSLTARRLIACFA